MPDTEQVKVDYTRPDGSTSTAYVDLPVGGADEMEAYRGFDGVDKHTDEPVRIRYDGEQWEIAPEGELAFLGVRCDGPGETGSPFFCTAEIRADFRVRLRDDQATRIGYVLDHAARNGWRVEGRENPLTAKTFCPAHA